MSNDHDHNDDRDRDHANDNGEHERPGSKPASVPAASALTSLAALETAFANVNTATYIGRTGRPMLLFKSREGSGTWGFGQKRTIPEEGSRWAVNPMTFKWGYISFADNKKVAGEEMVSVTKSKPNFAELPDTGFPWQEQWSVDMKCLDGADAGIEVTHKANTDGTRSAIVSLFDQVRGQIISEQQAGKELHNSKIVAIVLLEKDSYQHAKHGPISIPVLNLVDWMTLDGPAPTPAPAPTPTSEPASASVEQPRRRRVS
jgi:hypothetical protein